MFTEKDERYYAVLNEEYMWEEGLNDEKDGPHMQAPHMPETGLYGLDGAPVLPGTQENSPAPNPVYAQNPAYMPSPAYAPHPAYAQNPAYMQNPAYIQNPAYAAEPAYVPNPVYVQNPAYAAEPAYVPNPAYVQNPAYTAEPAYVQNPPPQTPPPTPEPEDNTQPILSAASLEYTQAEAQQEEISLIKLAEEAEKQAQMAAEAAKTANMLAQDMMANMQMDGNRALQHLSISACKNAYYASEVAVQAQISALQTHVAAVTQTLAELDASKNTIHYQSQDIIQLSKESAQAQEEADQARIKAERARMEYAAKQNAALSNRDMLAQAKREYDLKQTQMRQSQKALEIVQQRANHAHDDFVQLRQQLEERRKQWQNMQKMQLWMPEQEYQRPAPMEQPLPPISTAPAEFSAPTAFTGAYAYPAPAGQPDPRGPTEAAAPRAPAYTPVGEPERPRNQVAAITLPAPQPAPPFGAQPQPAIAGMGALDQAATGLPELTAVPEKEEQSSRLWLYTKILAAAFAVVLCLRVFVFDVVLVEGVSMVPTLKPSDSLISSKITYMIHDPQRGDIILLDAPDDSGYYIKRIIGLPNEHIQIMNGQVFINGMRLHEEYLENVQTDGDINTVIPDGQYFVMGDNRPASRDSRVTSVGLIAKEHINGKAIARFYPLKSMKLL